MIIIEFFLNDYDSYIFLQFLQIYVLLVIKSRSGAFVTLDDPATTAGNWYTKDFPLPVGIETYTSFCPPTTHFTASFCSLLRNRSCLKTVLSLSNSVDSGIADIFICFCITYFLLSQSWNHSYSLIFFLFWFFHLTLTYKLYLF